MKLTSFYRNIFLLALLVILVAAIGGGLWIRHDLYQPHAHKVARKVVTIEPRASTAAIITRLHREGVLAHRLPAQMWMWWKSRDQSFKAGDYEFKSPITPLEVLRKLVRGEVTTRHFTIPEGYNQFDIARVLAELPGLKQPQPEKPEALLGLFRNTSLIADLDPQATTLEGYLFPDTYEYMTTTTREQLVEIMVRQFRKVFTSDMQKRASELGMSIRQTVTLASLIEKEAKVDSERELISSVFHRRLKLGMMLACDPTVIYAALREGRYRGKIYQSDLNSSSPYNTYKRAGLPPGPIASPGRRSLQAALNPAQTDYLFFVVDATRKDGSHKFSAASADHERAVAALRHWEREQQVP